MTPWRSAIHAAASASDSACNVSDAAGEMTRKQNGRPPARDAPSSAPGFTHDTVRSTAGTASSATSRDVGSGAAARLTNDHAAPIPAPMPRRSPPGGPPPDTDTETESELRAASSASEGPAASGTAASLPDRASKPAPPPSGPAPPSAAAPRARAFRRP
jgi:hypothetical protein